MTQKKPETDIKETDIERRNRTEAGMIMVKRVGDTEFRPIQDVADEEAQDKAALADEMQHGASQPSGG